MHYLVENTDQFSKLAVAEQAYVRLIAGNDSCHPLLDNPSLVYYNAGTKGYILCIKHSETFGISFEKVRKFLAKHKRIYVCDKKYHSYFLDFSNIIDVNFTLLDCENEINPTDHKTRVHHDFYAKYYEDFNLNCLVPVAKHYETCESEYNAISQYIGKESNTQFLDKMITAYKFVEEQGIGVDPECIHKTHPIKCTHHSMIGSKVLTYYNLYNLTCRPTNSFNGINFLAIPKEGEYRKCFVADNYFVEFDFDAYHPRLIAKLIGYEFPSNELSVHSYMAKHYFGTEVITEDQYSESKTLTFKQLYGGVQRKYQHIPFLKATAEYTEKTFEIYKLNGGYHLPTGRYLKYSDEMTAVKLFNYVIQNMETYENVNKILEVQEYLTGTNTKLVMITYDSFLFDFDPEDGKETLVRIKEIMEQGGMKVKYKYGETYSFYENK